jgi:hypothetical protein
VDHNGDPATSGKNEVEDPVTYERNKEEEKVYREKHSRYCELDLLRRFYLSFGINNLRLIQLIIMI